MRRVALKIAYIGTDFYGFQRQPGLLTVEGEILSALKEVGVIDRIDRCGFGIAGRTDRGVHALGNVISFLTEERVIINQINNSLPDNIRVWAQARVPLRFMARYAQSRHYRYLVINNPVISGIEDLDIEKMTEASKLFRGTHNFCNFSKRSERNPNRTIDQIEVIQGENFIRVDVIGESFLWNMVRKIVTVLLRVGCGKIEPDMLPEYFNPQKKVAIKPMPPEGLILMDVKYAGVKFDEDSYALNSFQSYLKKEYLKSQSIALSEMEMINSLRRD